MQAHNEIIHFENPFMFVKIFESMRNDTGIGGWHYHKEIEFLAVLEGNLGIFIEEDYYNLGPGDVVMVGSAQLHRDHTYEDAGVKYLVFQFDIERYFDAGTMPYLIPFLESRFPLSKLNYIFEEDPAVKSKVFSFINDIYNENARKDKGYEIAVSILIKQILLTLIRNDKHLLLQNKENVELLRLRPALDYVENHITRKIHVEEVSRVINISYYYFIKYFKKVMGISFTDYVNFRKIKLAERILLTKDVSVSEVGEMIGMPNMAHFYKFFKKYNTCSPNEFRKKMQVPKE